MPSLLYVGPSLQLLHSDYAKRRRVDERAQLASSSSICIAAPAREVWRVLVSFRDWRLWAPAIEMPDVPDVAPDVDFVWKLNGVAIRSKLGVVDEDRELNWTGRFLWFKAVERFVLTETSGGGAEVTLAESLAGPLLPLFYSARQLRTNHERWLTALKRRVETGA